MKTQSNRHAIGFTLIELMVVIALAAILLALAAPSFTGYLGRQRLQGAAAEFVTDLQYARSEAVQRNAIVRLATGAGGACYAVFVWTGAGSCDCTATPGSACTGGPTEIKTVQFGTTGVSVTASTTFEFEPIRGGLNPPGSTGSATLSSSSGGTWQLRADVTTVGRVSTCSPSGSIKGFTSC